ncbi:Zinc metalloproteinase nas-36 [Amphibalanus amphitrite]|uniref:Zinc metalloproteinase nas-36 n=2 Tax=Amphibalanus amphitrite TaxID=1232801 RepID=A0A6A4W3H2_AMPAM|nr:Zinc metalloproteinase nas-36 [Amphibalanus amphitrite]
MKKDWSQGAACKKGQGFQSTTPLPYDYRSVMQYGEADFGDGDSRMIFAAKDPRYQYMFDYTRSGGYLQSHYDLLLINMIYKCGKQWAASCKSAPKCENHGYLQKNCKCACAAGFQGSRCEKKHGSLFPPLDRAKAVIDDHRAGFYNFKKRGMHTNNNNYPLSRFIYYQYATMYLRGRDKTTMVSVRVFEPGEVARSYSMKAFQVSGFFTDMDSRDCEFGMRFYWGDFASGRVRTECVSTFINNEPKSNALMLRAKTNVIGIVIIGKLGEFFPYAEFTKWMIEMLQFRVWFLTRPQSVLKLLQSKGGPKVVIGASTTEDPVLGGSAVAAAKSLAGNGGVLAAIIGVPVVLLTLAAGGVLCWWRAKKSRTPQTLADKLFGSQSESSSSSSDDD